MSRVPDIEDAEDILQDVFCELIEAVRLMKPIEHASAAWAGRGITCHGTVMSGARASPRLLEALRQE